MPARPHVLVAEDEALIAMMLGDFLIDEGYRVTIAADGLAAFRSFRLDPAEVVITDIRMPVMDGFELISRVRELAPSVPVIVLSGHVRLGQSKGIEDARTTLVEKPCDPRYLAGLVRSAVEGKTGFAGKAN